jgi:hypothetical protein
VSGELSRYSDGIRAERPGFDSWHGKDLLLLLLLLLLFLIGITETFYCSMSARGEKIVPLLDVHQLLMLFCRDVDVFGARNVLLSRLL